MKKELLDTFDGKEGIMDKSDVKKYVVEKPAYEVIPIDEVKGRIPAMTLMSSRTRILISENIPTIMTKSFYISGRIRITPKTSEEKSRSVLTVNPLSLRTLPQSTFLKE
jgi:hypothetical protein